MPSTEPIDRPEGDGRQILASEGAPTRSGGLTLIVTDAAGDVSGAFIAETDSANGRVVHEWDGVRIGDRVALERWVIELTEVPADGAATFTVWER